MATRDDSPAEPFARLRALEARVAELEGVEERCRRLEQELAGTRQRRPPGAGPNLELPVGFEEPAWLLRGVIAALHDTVIFGMDREGTYLFCWADPAVMRRAAITTADLVGKRLGDLFPPEEAQRRLADLERIFSTGQPQREEYAMRLPGGEFWHDISLGPFRDEQGRITAVLGVIRDVTDRKRAEASHQESEERYRGVVEQSSDCIILHSGGKIVFANPATLRTLGMKSAEEMLGRTALDFVHPDDRPSVLARIAEAARSTVGVPPSEERFVRSDGAVFYGETAARRVIYAGEPTIMVVIRDVTERRRMQAEVAKAQRLEAVGLLAGGIAHDFNNILTAIAGNVSLAKKQAPLGGSLEGLLDAAERGTQRASDLTQQLLTFARGGTPIRRAASLPELIHESADFALRGSPTQARFLLPDDLWDVEVDPGQIGRVIQNLVLNAAQAMGEGGCVELRAENLLLDADAAPGKRPGRYVSFSVIDHGSGVAPDVLPRIFDPYFTTKQGGSGLGLAVTHSVVAKHDGRIEVESEIGQGTTVRVLLPASEERASREPAGAQAEFQGHGRILLMDDDADVRQIAAQMLQELGFEVVVAADGAEALAIYRAARERPEEFAFVVLDLTVPGGMGGVACAAELRQLDPDVRLVVASGYSVDPVMAHPEEHGFTAVVAKPFGLDALREALRTR
jgi:PAS domain S-box-containing protein